MTFRRRLFCAAIALTALAWLTLLVVSLRTQQFTVKSISTFPFNQQDGTANDIPPSIKRLDGQRIQLVGEMWAGQSAADELQDFEFVDTKHVSSFDGPPLVQHFIKCHSNTKVPYLFDDRVLITGIFHVDVRRGDGYIEQVFRVDVERLEPVPLTFGDFMEQHRPWSWTAVYCLFTGPVMIAIYTVWHCRRKHARFLAGLCTACGYDLRASAERCPECGKVFRKTTPTGVELI